VLQGGVWSNPVNLTVSTPNIARVTPRAKAAAMCGWAALTVNSVPDAVKAGNSAAAPVGSQYTWQIIGDGNVKIAGASN